MENIMVRVCNHLHGLGAAVTVCCLSKTGPFAERLHPGVAVRVLDKPPGFSWKAVHELRQIMVQGRFQVVHTHHLGGLIYSSLARLPRTRPSFIHSEHIMWGAADLGKKRQWQRKALYRGCACIFTVAEQQMRQMRQMGHRHPWQTTLVNGVDAAHFQPSASPKHQLRQALGLPQDGLWLIKVARFGDTKRHADLIRAFEAAHQSRPHLRLLLVGDGGPEKEAVLRQMQESPARDSMHWAGFQQNPLPYYQAADILVVASSFEGLPNAVLEGMACGLPVLANEACGVLDVAQDGLHGWAGDFSTADKLSHALVAAADASPAALERMGAAAREHVVRQFSMETMLGRYERLYHAVADGQRVNLQGVTGQPA